MRAVTRAVGAGVVLLGLVGGMFWSVSHWRRPHEYYFGGIACHEVRAHLPAYLAGTLPEELAGRIRRHLQECPACREAMRRMVPPQASAKSDGTAACTCAHCRAHRGQAEKPAQAASSARHFVGRTCWRWRLDFGEGVASVAGAWRGASGGESGERPGIVRFGPCTLPAGGMRHVATTTFPDDQGTA
jgi:anti-sigma factor RsiW